MTVGFERHTAGGLEGGIHRVHVRVGLQLDKRWKFFMQQAYMLNLRCLPYALI